MVVKWLAHLLHIWKALELNFSVGTLTVAAPAV